MYRKLMVGGHSLHTVHIAMIKLKISQLCLVQFCHHNKDSGCKSLVIVKELYMH